jgi:mono/diheme cytochrome c family protein
MRTLRSIAAFLCIAATAIAADPDQEKSVETTAAGEQFFESHVRPLLATHCFKCHGPDKQKAGLRLDSLEGVLTGGDSGPAIVAGDVAHSPIVMAVRYSEDFVQMPPTKKLADEQIASIVKWVEMGAPWPGADREALKRPAKAAFEISDDDRAWWAYQPLQRPQNSLDEIIEAQLDEKHIAANGSATKRELIRRATFDLLGIPPTPEDVEAFESDDSPHAFAELIDRLLERPEYGQRWARHWLDVVRFAQTNGYERDDEKPYAWQYRDYVIRAFNEDKPYDQFITEQLAGDEIEPLTDDAIIATGFYRLGVWDDEPDDARAAEFEALDDIVVTVSAAFMGLTVGCARCHDHMFDPIPQADYYRLVSFFRNVRQYEKLTLTPDSAILRPLPSAGEEITKHFANQTASIERLKQAIKDTENEKEKKSLRKDLEKAKMAETSFDWALSVRERGAEAPPTHVLIRGNAASPGEEVQPAFLAVMGGETPEISTPVEGSQTTGRRTALARWLTDPSNPLAARVMANRVWQHHFGHGIVKTTSDFGRAGLEPTHPELLDRLAAELVDGGWSIKHLHRAIMNSAAYQRSSSTDNVEGVATDGANDLYWRQNLRRLEAEAIRDTVLAVSGELDTSLDGRGFFPRLGAEVLAGASKPGMGWEMTAEPELVRRSVYTFVKRTIIPPSLDQFDFASTAQPVGERPTTTVAPQSLFLLNDTFIHQRAAKLADRLEREVGNDAKRQIERAYQLAFGRRPTDQETSIALAYLNRQQRVFSEMPWHMTFRPLVPTTLAEGFLTELKATDHLDGPREGWAYYRGLWKKGYQGVKALDPLRSATALWQGPKFHNGTVEATVRLHDSSEFAALVLRATPEGDVFHGYDVTLDPQAGAVSLRRHGSDVTLLGEASAPIVTGKSLHVKVAASGAHWQVWVDSDEPVLDIVDPEPLNDAGRLGIRTWGAPVDIERLTTTSNAHRVDLATAEVQTLKDDEAQPPAGWSHYGGFWTRQADGAYAVDASPGAKAIWDEPVIGDGTVTAQVMLQSQRGDAGLVVRVGHATNGVDALDAYNINLRPSGLRLGRHLSNWRQLVVVPQPLALDVWHEVRVQLDGKRIRVWLNGSSEPLIDFEDENALEAGRVGFRTFNADCAIRNLCVTSSDRTWNADFAPSSAENEPLPKQQPPKSAERRALEAFCLLLFNLNEMIYVD